MQDKFHKLQEKILRHIPADWPSVIQILYGSYDSNAENNCPRISEYHRVIEEYTRDLPVEIQNEICTAVVGLCVEYERTAFTDGVLVGARFVFALAEQ